MIKASYEFDSGYAKPVHRGVHFWNGGWDDVGPDNPQRWVDDLVYDAIGAKDAWSSGYDLKGIKITIEIAEVAAQ